MRVLTSTEETQNFSKDSGIIVLNPKAVYIVQSEGEVPLVVDKALEQGVTITPRGSGTGIPSQSVGRGFVLVQDRKAVRVEGASVFCEPAAIKADVNSDLESEQRWLPVDPSSYRMCSVGGMVSNNSSSARTFKYGSTIDYVEELRVLLPGKGICLIAPLKLEDALHSHTPISEIANLIVENWKTINRESPKVSKNSCGYRLDKVLHDGIFDLPKLFVGSEGTLGIITEIKFRTIAKKSEKALVVVDVGNLSDLEMTVGRLRSHSPTALEMIGKSIFVKSGNQKLLESLTKSVDGYLVYCEFDGDSELEIETHLEGLSADELIMQFDPLVATDVDQINRAWDVRSKTLVVAEELRSGSRYAVPGVEDLIVPREKLGELLEFLQNLFEGRGLEYISYGHAGDANLHVRPLLDPREEKDRKILEDIMRDCFEKVWKMEGSMTGEHGDGMLRANYVQEQYKETHEIMLNIRRILDPKGLLNPGVKIV